MTQLRPKLVITDVDNTLYDWVSFYVPCFRVMLRTLHELSGIPEDVLRRDFKRVHRRHQTTEYSFAIEELESITRLHPNLTQEERLRKYMPAVSAFRKRRAQVLRLYPEVRITLKTLRSSKVEIVAYSDTIRYPLVRRLRDLDVDFLFDAVFATRDPGLPDGLREGATRFTPREDAGPRTHVRELPKGIRKPNPRALTTILEELKVAPREALYVGDSVSKDIAMAQACGVKDVWARYGTRVADSYVEELEGITFWSEEAIGHEKRLHRRGAQIVPSHTIERFSEILDITGLAAP